MVPDYEALQEELERRETHLTALLGERLRVDMEALKRGLHIFGRNQIELSKHIARFVESQTDAPNVTSEYLNELVRLLHNFITSVYSYVESTRVVMRHRWGSNDSEFERGECSEQRLAVFGKGEAEFMTDLRHYCTHYNVPVPGLSTTFTWARNTEVQQHNRLLLKRDVLLRSKRWTGSARAFLEDQEPEFDFEPIVNRYTESTRAFFVWFWRRIAELSVELTEERNAKATEVRLWIEECRPPYEWVMSENGIPAPMTSLRRDRASRRIARYLHGTQGFRIITAGLDGNTQIGSTDWQALPR
ncbi:hypothetical protein [Mycobacteroides chelonae]|uniref:hypothetical protein n=1 Tax=Mycobacteroides chelonae TaxID=1774 RepID=UPI0009948B2B|nr:hypothetical protein [Mycobacteroides chelonae]